MCKWIWTLLSLSLLGLSCRSPDHASDLKLVGGRKVAATEMSATVLLRSGCTGTKIQSDMIITAGHCVLSKEFGDIKPQFLAGETILVNADRKVYRSLESGDLELGIKNTYVVPDYVKHCENHCLQPESLASIPPYPRDLAVIVLEPATLPQAFKDLPLTSFFEGPLRASQRAHIAGYGCEKGAFDPVPAKMRLKSKELGLLDQEQIRSVKQIEDGNKFTDHFHATPGQNWQKEGQILGNQAASLCPGDSGGPLYIKTGEDYQLAGIHSFMIAPEDDDRGISLLNAHTKVDKVSGSLFHDWLARINRSEDLPTLQENPQRESPLARLDKIYSFSLNESQREVSFLVKQIPFGRYAVSTLARFKTKVTAIDVKTGEAIAFEPPRYKAPRSDGMRFSWHNATFTFDAPKDLEVTISSISGDQGPLSVKFNSGQGCRYCRFAFKLSGSLVKNGSPLTEWEMVHKIHRLLKKAGFNNWVYRNSLEVSKKHKKVWVNIKMKPGGSGTERFDQKRFWYVSKGALVRVFSGKLDMISLSSYVSHLD